jgi:hypothetical protein
MAQKTDKLFQNRKKMKKKAFELTYFEIIRTFIASILISLFSTL